MTHVLVVDDERLIRDVVGRLLAVEGYAVDVVPDAGAALDVIRSGKHFDVLVTDINLSEMNGEALVSTLRQESELKVLYISGRSELPRSSTAYDPTTAYLRKPFTRTELLNVIALLTATLA